MNRSKTENLSFVVAGNRPELIEDICGFMPSQETGSKLILRCFSYLHVCRHVRDVVGDVYLNCGGVVHALQGRIVGGDHPIIDPADKQNISDCNNNNWSIDPHVT